MTGSRALHTILVIAGFVAAVAAVAIAVALLLQPHTMHDTTRVEASFFGRRVLVIAPHPDDEVLSSGGLIQQLLHEGAQVRVVIVTAGDGYYRAANRLVPRPPDPVAYLHLGEVRHEESLAAAARLGLKAADVVELGFPDTGTSALWDADWGRDRTHVGRNGAVRVPYTWALRTDAPFSGRELADELASVVSGFRPDTVISSDTHETHPDHAAVGAFTLLALDETGFTGRHLTYYVHFKRYPYPWAYLPGASLQPPPQVTDDGSTWYALPLTAEQERVKRIALNDYHSQVAVPDLAVFLDSFVRANELFNLRPDATPATQTSDGVPGPQSGGTVVVTPAPAAFTLVPPRVRINSVRMVRGPHAVWFGLVCDERVDSRNQFRLSLALASSETTTARLDVLVRDSFPQVERTSADSLQPTGVGVQVAGNTLWISVPSSVFTGRTHAIIATSGGKAGTPPFRTPVRDVAL